MRKEADVAVVGAGVAGSSMAYVMAKKGWDVVLLDKEKYPRHKACGEFLSPEAQSTLRRFDLEAKVRALNPAIVTRVRIHWEHGGSLEIPLPGQAWGISRYALDAMLQNAAQEAGACLITSCAVSQATPAAAGYLVEAMHEGSPVGLLSRVLIDAGGRRAFHSNRTSDASNSQNYVGIKSHYASLDRTPVVDLYFFRGGYVGISPVEGERLNVAALIRSSAFQSLGASYALERILENACRHVPALKQRLTGATPLPETRSATSPVRIRRTPCAWNEYPRVGDAVAVIPPFCGDGMSMALRSSELCAPLADEFLNGSCTAIEWRHRYVDLIDRQFSGALRWGGLLERVMTHSVLGSLMLRLGAILPKTAQRLLRATRLRS